MREFLQKKTDKIACKAMGTYNQFVDQYRSYTGYDEETAINSLKIYIMYIFNKILDKALFFSGALIFIQFIIKCV